MQLTPHGMMLIELLCPGFLVMLDIDKLRTADGLRGKITDILKPDDIIELAKKQEIPHYILINPLTKEEVFCFLPSEVNEWFRSFIYERPAISPVHLNFINYDSNEYKLGPADLIPQSLAVIKQLKKIPLATFETPPGIYFLCKDQEIVYIGQAQCVASRVLAHKTQKDYDSIFFIHCHINQLCPTEKALIRFFKPKLNYHMTQKDVNEVDSLILGAIGL